MEQIYANPIVVLTVLAMTITLIWLVFNKTR